MDYKEIREYVHSLDSTPYIMEPLLGNWSIWSIIKKSIYFLILNEFHPQQISKTKSNKALTKKLRLLRNAVIGAGQYLNYLKRFNKPHLYVHTHSSSRSEKTVEGCYLDIFLDELLNSRKLELPPIVIEEEANWPHLSPPCGPRHCYDDIFSFAVRIWRRKLIKTIERENSVDEIVGILNSLSLPINRNLIKNVLINTLSNFEAERLIYKMFVVNSETKALVIVNAIARQGILAAAKESNIPVIELQHGIIGGKHYTFDWGFNAKPYKSSMPIPDKILVYGDLWQDLLTEEGFWEKDEIIPVGSARYDRFNNKVKKQESKNKKTIDLLFTTQYISRNEAILFLSEYLKIEDTDNQLLTIKVHPIEREYVSEYQELENLYPENCKVIFDEEDTYTLLLKSDIHISYQSTVLLESISLGVPSISICGKFNPGGFAASFEFKGIDAVIKHIMSIYELNEIVTNYMHDNNYRNNWLDNVEQHRKTIYTKGFIEKASRVINSQLI